MTQEQATVRAIANRLLAAAVAILLIEVVLPAAISLQSAIH